MYEPIFHFAPESYKNADLTKTTWQSDDANVKSAMGHVYEYKPPDGEYSHNRDANEFEGWQAENVGKVCIVNGTDLSVCID